MATTNPRAVGAMIGIYGENEEEAVYFSYQSEKDGHPLEGQKLTRSASSSLRRYLSSGRSPCTICRKGGWSRIR